MPGEGPPVGIAAFAGATIVKENIWATSRVAFKMARFLFQAPFLFGYVPGFSLNGTVTDILITFVLIFFGTWLYSRLLSGIRME